MLPPELAEVAAAPASFLSILLAASSITTPAFSLLLLLLLLLATSPLSSGGKQCAGACHQCASSSATPGSKLITYCLMPVTAD
jgi:hypothetical protein